MSSALSVPVPEYLQKYVKPEGGWASQFGELSQQDFGLNFIKIVAANTKYVRPGWGPTKQEPAMAAGTMFLSRDGTTIPPGTKFIPLYRNVRYIKWIGKPGEGRIDFMANSKNDPRIKACKGLEFTKDRDGQNVAPLVTEYINFYVFCQYCEAPVILSFKRTGIPDGHKLTQDILMATKGGSLPLFSLMFELNQPKEVIDGNLQWYLYSLKAAGFTPEAMTDRAAKLAEMAESISEMATEQDYAKAETDEPTRAVNEAKPVEGGVLGSVPIAPPPSTVQVGPVPTVVTAPPPTAPIVTAPPVTAPPAAPAQQPAAATAPAGTVKLW